MTRYTPGSIIVPVGQVVETETAQPIAWAPKRRLISQASETNQAQPLTIRKLASLGIAVETDLAQALSRSKRRTLGPSVETDLAQSLAWNPKCRLVGPAAETDLAQPMISSAGTKLLNVVAVVVTMNRQVPRLLSVTPSTPRTVMI